MKYLVVIAVKCTAPKGYKPRTSTYKGFGLTSDKKEVEKLKQKAIDEVKNDLESNNPGLTIKYSVSATIQTNNFYVTTAKLMEENK